MYRLHCRKCDIYMRAFCSTSSPTSFSVEVYDLYLRLY